MGSRAGNDLGRFCPANLHPILSSWTPTPPYKRAVGTVGGGSKTVFNLTPISTPTTYAAINHPFLTSIPQEPDKLADSLAAQARDTHISARSPRAGVATNSSAFSGLNYLICIGARIPDQPSMSNRQRGSRGGHPLWKSRLRQQGGGVYSCGVGQTGAGKAHGRFPFVSGHLPPKPVDLACIGHPSGGKEDVPSF